MSDLRHPNFRASSPAPLDYENGGADQAAVKTTNINNIVASYETTGQYTHVARSDPFFGDVSDAGTLHSAMNTVLAAQEHFRALPASVRQAAGNDPVQFLAMCADDEGAEILVDAGLEFSDAPELTPEDRLRAAKANHQADLDALDAKKKPAPDSETTPKGESTSPTEGD